MAASDEGSRSGALATKRATAALVVFAALVGLAFVIRPEGLYLWIKAAHVMAVIAWMAGLFYLPRLYVYHADAPAGSPQSELLKVMERRLYRLIVNPAMVVTWVLGLWLAWDGFGFRGGWLHAKLAAVFLLSGFHGYLGASLRRFAEDRNQKPARHWRLVNEIPTLLMVAIVVLVIVKPF